MNERIALYSACLYDVASENGCEKDVYECLCDVREVMLQFEEYVKIVSSSSIAPNERENLVETAFFSSHPYVLNLMKLLAKKRLLNIFNSVAKEYEKTYFKNNNIERCVITTAIALDEKKKTSIVERLEKAMGKKLIPHFVVDEKILGGIVVETDNSNFDASVTGALGAMKRLLSAGR